MMGGVGGGGGEGLVLEVDRYSQQQKKGQGSASWKYSYKSGDSGVASRSNRRPITPYTPGRLVGSKGCGVMS